MTDNETIRTLKKINEFIQQNKSVNYMIVMLDRKVPNLEELIVKLSIKKIEP